MTFLFTLTAVAVSYLYLNDDISIVNAFLLFTAGMLLQFILFFLSLFFFPAYIAGYVIYLIAVSLVLYSCTKLR